MLREQITESMKNALKNKDERTLATSRMILAKMKDLDIAARPKGNMNGIGDDEICGMLQGMIKQRRESIDLYKQGNRQDLVDQESAEIAVIETFLPKQMSEDEVKAAIKTIMAETQASSIKDMGKVMAEMKKKYVGQMDFSQASALVKSILAA